MHKPQERHDVVEEETPLIQNVRDDQAQILTHRQLLFVFPALAFAYFTSYLDQTSVATAIPAIANGIQAGSSISWIGASFMASSTSFQLINGRVSDIFGRKSCLITAVGLLGIGNLLSGFCQTPVPLYLTRAFSGVGAGAINTLVQICISDFTTLQQRGLYGGMIDTSIALGNGLGPVVGGLLTDRLSWRWAFWFISPMSALSVIYLFFAIPEMKVEGHTWDRLQMMDWAGVGLSLVAVLLILIPISQGGAAFPWDSPIIILMLLLGLAAVTAFLIVEFRYAKLPIMPLRLFQNGISANILIAQCFLMGFIYWGNLFYIPVYFQNIRGWSAEKAGVLLLPIVLSHAVSSLVGGFIINRTGHYKPVIFCGEILWTMGAMCKIWYGFNTPAWAFVVAGIMEGFSIGFCFQPTLIGILAHSLREDRAVITGLRSFTRAIGGVVGLVVSGAILNNILHHDLDGLLSPAQIQHLTSSVFGISHLDLAPAIKEAVLNSYMSGLHTIFAVYCPVIGLCLISTLFVTDIGLAGKKVGSEAEAEAEN